MKEYQTEQRKALLRFFKENQSHKFSIDEIVEGLPAELSISKSAIYRNIDKMAQDELVTKSILPGSRKAVYQYISCGRHCTRIHLRCEKCGRLLHLENRSDEEKLNALLQENGFSLDDHATVLQGICKDCTIKK